MVVPTNKEHLVQVRPKPHVAQALINPRRTCAARVTVLIRHSVCLTLILELQATKQLIKSDTNGFSATWARILMWRFC